MAAARAGKPMMSHPQVANRYPVNSYYGHPSSMPYPSQSQVPPMHRSMSQGSNPSPYSMPPTPMASNGAANKPMMNDPMEIKSEDSLDDPSKQQMFHPLIQTRPRPPAPSYYPTMSQQSAVPSNAGYYSNQRPLVPPTSDYNMAMARGMRPNNPYAMAPRMRPPLTTQLSAPMTDPTTGMPTNSMGLQSTPPPPSVTPR